MTSTIDTREHHTTVGVAACAFLCGAMTGAVLTALFAPARGRDMRQRLVAKARESRDRASAALARGRGVVDRTRAHLRDQAEHASRAVAEGRAAVADVRDRGERALDSIHHEAAQAVADAGAAYRDVRSVIAGRPEE
jgi:gas vesicle protein